MKRTLGLILAAVLLGGCSPSSQIVDVTDVQYEPVEQTPQAEALPTPSPTPGPYVTEDIFVVECEDGINLRESSSSKSDLIGTLLPGDRVKVLGYQSQRFGTAGQRPDRVCHCRLFKGGGLCRLWAGGGAAGGKVFL